jgi:hypothetical protein
MRRAARKDESQRDIVNGLRDAGYEVVVLGRPVDLLIGIWAGYCKVSHWKLLEVKTPTKGGKIRLRKDQQAQQDFCRETGTPIVSTLEEALEALK